eukprot:CAMPEP_0115873234 /NCGR_PEP_ID=MMETSP0287-20121206/23884_1 /TAXON_ID=412157 /ORGANISM="Chrysochromulina rotalis, Strain UIO044" /LENGTH=79 /DNA_ID=CAMNT_0003328275 /DNA_START=261 /DNA_END=500 /DNA_ORIENTATION=-
MNGALPQHHRGDRMSPVVDDAEPRTCAHTFYKTTHRRAPGSPRCKPDNESQKVACVLTLAPRNRDRSPTLYDLGSSSTA